MALARALAIEPEVLLLDEPFGALDARVRKDLRAWLRRLHDEMHVTTVFVTHDQEEAMEVSDRIVVMNHGQVEQVGDPHELYEQPANDFVMGFVGPVTRLGDTLIRPHDIEIRREPNGTTSGPRSIASPAWASRCASTWRCTTASASAVQVTREDARYSTWPGQVGVRAAPADRQFAEAPAG